MKTRLTTAFILMLVAISAAQDANWKSLSSEQSSLVSFQFGYNYGVTGQLGYGRVANIVNPVLLTLDFSFPMGEKQVDDFKIRCGGHIELLEKKGFILSAKMLANFRRYQTTMVRIASFGADFSALAGYYQSTWHTAVEVGFDKAISSHLKHSILMRETVYSDIQDGWYVPTGGNWYYGFTGSKSLGPKYDITGRVGATNAQNNDEDALLPFYLQFGLNIKF